MVMISAKAGKRAAPDAGNAAEANFFAFPLESYGNIVYNIECDRCTPQNAAGILWIELFLKGRFVYVNSRSQRRKLLPQVSAH
jgi:hypothetical protein